MVNIISDSPTSQYRNKKIFWMIQSFAKEQKINIKWIYLDSCHGSGVADGIGATVKNAISNIVLLHLISAYTMYLTFYFMVLRITCHLFSYLHIQVLTLTK